MRTKSTSSRRLFPILVLHNQLSCYELTATNDKLSENNGKVLWLFLQELVQSCSVLVSSATGVAVEVCFLEPALMSQRNQALHILLCFCDATFWCKPFQL